jgi:hypothetical protein
MRPRSIVIGSCALAGWLATTFAVAQDDPTATDRGALSLAAARKTDALPAGAVKLTPVETMSAHPHPPTASGKVRVPLAFEGLAARTIDTDEIRITSGAAAIVRAPNGAPLLELAGEGLVIVSSEPGKDSAAESEIRNDRKTPLPWLVIETQRVEGGTAVRTARPFLTLAKAIEWRGDAQRHVAEFLFGLDPERGEPGPMTQPLEARLTVTCNEVEPQAARVAQIGPAGYGVVRVGCSREVKNERRLQQLEVHVDRGTLSYAFQIPRRPGAIALRGSSQVLGFGFGDLLLTVGRVEEDGTPMKSDAQAEVQLVVDEGRLDVDAITLRAGAHEARVHAHPPGLGRLSVRALAGALQSPPLVVELTWPLLAVTSMLLGGTLGGYLCAHVMRKSPRHRRWRTFEGTMVGLLVTLIVLVLRSLSLLPDWARETELGLFVLAAAAGFIGTPLLERGVKKLFPMLARSDPG